MKLMVKFYEGKDEDLIKWINTIDKEAISFVIKSIIRSFLKNQSENSLDPEDKSEKVHKLDKMF